MTQLPGLGPFIPRMLPASIRNVGMPFISIHFYMTLIDFICSINPIISQPPQKKTSGQISWRHHLNKPCLVCDLSMAVRVAMQPARMQHHIGVCGWLELGGRISLGNLSIESCWIPTDLQYIIGPLCHLSIHVMDPFFYCCLDPLKYNFRIFWILLDG